MEPLYYIIANEDVEKLRRVNKRLFGDGKHLTPDERRDLANMMFTLLDKDHLMPVYDEQKAEA